MAGLDKPDATGDSEETLQKYTRLVRIGVLRDPRIGSPGDTDFLGQYLEKVCEFEAASEPDRPLGQKVVLEPGLELRIVARSVMKGAMATIYCPVTLEQYEELKNKGWKATPYR